MKISLIVAMDRNRLIGNGGQLPWRLPADLERFKAVTMGKPIVMGRRTHESIGRPLPGRHNIVLTRQRQYTAPGCTVAHSIAQALEAAGDVAELMVIGGSAIYRQFLPRAQRLYLTLIDAAFTGDTYFPVIKCEEWEVISEEERMPDARNPHPFRFVVLQRKEGGWQDSPPAH
ncbi:MAG TPA: type 3 dihydrofolate reductase [Candidatus Sulfomarinibacteraceae bacterium]|nr:type 3 dihydrofolate reductase [Candidatus Sulfomarinibacteraceae bacterium]